MGQDGSTHTPLWQAPVGGKRRRLGRRVALRKLAQCLPGFLRPGEGRLELQRLLEIALGRVLILRRELRHAEVIADHGVVGELRRSLLEKRDRPRVDPALVEDPAQRKSGCPSSSGAHDLQRRLQETLLKEEPPPVQADRDRLELIPHSVSLLRRVL